MTAHKFYKRGAITAEQFDGSDEMVKRYGLVYRHLLPSSALGRDPIIIIIETMEGDLMIHDGDWIATGVSGEHWPIADEVFKKTYAELPVIPQAVGEYIRAKKRKNPNQSVYYLLRDTGVLWRRKGDSAVLSWMHDHPDAFARAWLEGYQIEEEADEPED
ncbi:DUF1642 domain-containing protein [Lacticaseibacillus absianus]|uniref:DUF1642 domain-containing protein n=1 Tax=Lacticaseibacillus absianus TaxID=2729623 RepID=UPI0015CE7F40|nr:DUF1642 domain-containing protein [Lacticaseibacillus absianus]